MRLATLATASALFVLSAALAVACGESNADPGTSTSDGGPTTTTDGATTTTSGGLPCDVDAVLQANCRKCHGSTPQFGAPMPLATYADLLAPAKSNPSKKVYELAVQKIDGANDVMPPPPNAPLSASDKAVLKAWAAAGAPSSSVDCAAPKDAGPPNLGVSCKPDLPIGPATPYEMPSASGDEYVCYGVELSRATPTHITGFVPRVDNTKIVHHIVLFESSQAYPTTPQKCNSGGSLQWRMVMGWAPGAKGLELPPEAGFPIATTGSTHYVVQMHYSNPLALDGQKDTSGFDLCTGPPRANEADVMAFGTQKIDVPALGTQDTTCNVTVQKVYNVDFAGIHLIAAMPHMHQIGREMSTVLKPAGGGPDVDLGTDLKFSFQTQAWYPIGTTAQGVVTKTGDVISTRCKWVNPTDTPVKFGENTADEMCYSFTLYYPKIQSPLWSWALPATASTCN